MLPLAVGRAKVEATGVIRHTRAGIGIQVNDKARILSLWALCWAKFADCEKVDDASKIARERVFVVSELTHPV